MSEKQVVTWITKGGKHIPIYAESDADKRDTSEPRSVAQKNIDIRDKQIAESKAVADMLNGKTREQDDIYVRTKYSNSLMNLPPKETQREEFKKGDTTYQIEKIGNNLYLRMKTGKIVEKYKIAFPKNPEKAHITVPGFGLINLKEEPGLIKLLESRVEHLL